MERKNVGGKKQVQVCLHQKTPSCPLRISWLALLCPQGDIPSTGKTDQAPLGAQHAGAGAKKRLHIAGKPERPLPASQPTYPPMEPKDQPKAFLPFMHSRDTFSSFHISLLPDLPVGKIVIVFYYDKVV